MQVARKRNFLNVDSNMKLIEYVENRNSSSSIGPYFDLQYEFPLGIWPNGITQYVELKVAQDLVSSSSYYWVLGNGSWCVGQNLIAPNNDGHFQYTNYLYAFSNPASVIPGIEDFTIWECVKLDSAPDSTTSYGSIEVNGQKFSGGWRNSDAEIQATNSMTYTPYLFTVNYCSSSGSHTGPGRAFLGKIRKYQLTIGGNLVIDLIPVKVNNEACFYDNVRNIVLHNAMPEAGEFICGPEI